ncbi:hypothetical protein BBF96_09665 [Anoxybacter fermentans]|uniref:Major facilitator superfamily (MFS) profile domain-containing protein n=1 Tax=Anoxybacter fermentans TaxID=1323375 RepID=A0A3Q9HQW6_9FIRM|nr:MFS transporter [Anoxybacter fermentans]AZR73630.1 hypothetical protein BBF96_09665 [Anoxybacter fermentans]
MNILLKNSNFRILWLGETISNLGNSFSQIAIIWLIKELTGSALSMGLSMLFFYIPAIIFNSFSGVVMDLYGRKKGLITFGFFQGIVGLIIPFLMFIDRINIIYIFLIITAMSILSSFYNPIRKSIIPDLVENTNINKAVSMMEFSKKITHFLGFGLAAIIIEKIRLLYAFVLDGSSFIVAAILFCNLKVKLKRSIVNNKKTMLKIKEQYINILRLLFNNKFILSIVVLYSFLNFYFIPMNIILTKLVEQFHGDISQYSYLMMAFVIGQVLSSIISGYIKNANHRLKILNMSFLIGALLGLLGFSKSFFITEVLIGLIGIVFVSLDIFIEVFLQYIIPQDIRTGVFSIVIMLGLCLTPISYIMVSYALEVLNVLFLFKIMGSSIILLSIIFGFVSGKYYNRSFYEESFKTSIRTN